MKPTLCSRCKKNLAVIFITKIDNGKTINEGLCLKCARELGIKPVDDLMQRMGITDDDLESLSGEMSEALGSLGMMCRGRRAGQPDGNVPVPQQALWRRAERGESACRAGCAQVGRAAARQDPEGTEKAQIPRYLLPEPHEKGARRSTRPHRRPRGRDRARHSDPQPPPEEQPLPDRRAGRRQDRHCGGACPEDRKPRRALQAPRQGGLPDGPDGAGRRNAVPRTV